MSRSPEAAHHALLGAGLKLCSVLCLSGMVACVKALGPAVPPGQVIFVRGLISMLVIAVVAGRTGGFGLLRTRNWRAHASRSLAGSLSMFCWFFSLTLIPLAEMTAISFTVPLFLTVLAVLVLGERIRAYRWTALALGFAGVVTIVGPDLATGGGNALGVGVALMAAMLAALAQMFVRRMSAEEHALTITFYFFLTSTALALATLAFDPWPAPIPGQWLLLGLVGAFGVVGQLAMTWSFHYAEASLLAPLDYLNMLLAVAIGFWLFGELPQATTWIGAPLVIASGGIILWREYAKLRRIRAVAPLDS